MANNRTRRFIRMCVFRKVKNGNLSCSHTNRKRSSFVTKHFQRNRHTHTQTHTQTHRPSTVTLAAHARRGLISMPMRMEIANKSGKEK